MHCTRCIVFLNCLLSYRMEKIFAFSLALCCLLSARLQAQHLIHFDNPIPAASIDGAFRSAIHVDSSQAVFHDQQAWIAEYKRMYSALSKHLKEGGLQLSKPLRLNVRTYFRPDGSIGHIAYNHAPTELDEQQAKVFNQLLESFAREYKVSFSANEPFKQCGPVLLQANVEEITKSE